MKWYFTPTISKLNQELASLCCTSSEVFCKLDCFTLQENSKTPTLLQDPLNPTQENPSEENNNNNNENDILLNALQLSLPDLQVNNFFPNQFTAASSIEQIKSNMSWQITSTIVSSERTCQEIWNTIENEISLDDCSLYQFTADTSGPLHTKAYFFLNQKLQKIIIFTFQEGSSFESDDENDFAFDSFQTDSQYGFGYF